MLHFQQATTYINTKMTIITDLQHILRMMIFSWHAWHVCSSATSRQHSSTLNLNSFIISTNHKTTMQAVTVQCLSLDQSMTGRYTACGWEVGILNTTTLCLCCVTSGELLLQYIQTAGYVDANFRSILSIMPVWYDNEIMPRNTATDTNDTGVINNCKAVFLWIQSLGVLIVTQPN